MYYMYKQHRGFLLKSQDYGRILLWSLCLASILLVTACAAPEQSQSPSPDTPVPTHGDIPDRDALVTPTDADADPLPLPTEPVSVTVAAPSTHTTTSVAPSVATSVPITPTASVTATVSMTPTDTAVPTMTLPHSRTLILWTTEPPHIRQVIDTLAQEYAASQSISLTVVAKNADSVLVDMIANHLAGIPQPDMIWANQDDLTALLLDGQIQPVALEYPVADYITATIRSATYDGKLWGYPLTLQHGLVLYYNRALVQQPPETTDQLIVVTRSSIAREGEGEGEEAPQPDEQPVAGIVAAWNEAHWLLPWLNGYGGLPISPDGSQPLLNTPSMTATLYLMRELYAAAPPDQTDYLDGRDRFINGQVAVAIDGDWAMETYREFTTTLDLGIAPLPVIPSTGQRAAPVMGSSYLMLPRGLSDERRAMVVPFASFVVSPAIQLRLATDMERLPVIRTVVTDMQLHANPLLAALATQAPDAVGLPPTEETTCVLRAITMFVLDVLRGDSEQPVALEQMQQWAETCVGE